MRINRLAEIVLQTDVQDLPDIVHHNIDKEWEAAYGTQLKQLVEVVNAASDLRDMRAGKTKDALGLPHPSLKLFPHRASLERIQINLPVVPLQAHPPLQAMPLLLLLDTYQNHLLAKYAPAAKKECDKAYRYHQKPDFKADTAVVLLGATLSDDKGNEAQPLRGVYEGENVDGQRLQIQSTDMLALPQGEQGWIAVGKKVAGNKLVAAHYVLMEKPEYDMLAGLTAAKKDLFKRLDLTHTDMGLNGQPLTYPNWWERVTHSYSNADLDRLSDLSSRVVDACSKSMSLSDMAVIRLVGKHTVKAFESWRGFPHYPETPTLSYALESARVLQKLVPEGPGPIRVLEVLSAANYSPARALGVMVGNHQAIAHALKDDPQLGTFFLKQTTALKHNLETAPPTVQRAGFQEQWRRAYDHLQDNGKGVQQAYTRLQNTVNKHPEIGSLQHQLADVACSFISPWRLSQRTKSLATTMFELCKEVLPTFTGVIKRTQGLMSGRDI